MACLGDYAFPNLHLDCSRSSPSFAWETTISPTCTWTVLRSSSCLVWETTLSSNCIWTVFTVESVPRLGDYAFPKLHSDRSRSAWYTLGDYALPKLHLDRSRSAWCTLGNLAFPTLHLDHLWSAEYTLGDHAFPKLHLDQSWSAWHTLGDYAFPSCASGPFVVEFANSPVCSDHSYHADGQKSRSDRNKADLQHGVSNINSANLTAARIDANAVVSGGSCYVYNYPPLPPDAHPVQSLTAHRKCTEFPMTSNTNQS